MCVCVNRRIGLRYLAITSLSRADVASRTVCSSTHCQEPVATVRYFGLLSVLLALLYASAVPAVAPCPSVRLSVTSRSLERHGQTDLAVFGTKVSFDLHCTLHCSFEEIVVTPKLRVISSGTLCQTGDSEVRNQNSPRRVDRRKCRLFSLTDDRRQFITLSVDPPFVCVRRDAARRAGPSAVAEFYPYHFPPQVISNFFSTKLWIAGVSNNFQCHVLLLILCRADIKVGVPSFSWTKKDEDQWPISWMASVLRCPYSISWVTHGRKGVRPVKYMFQLLIYSVSANSH